MAKKSEVSKTLIKNSKHKKITIITIAVVFVVFFLATLFKYHHLLYPNNKNLVQNPDQVFTLDELKKYNGQDPNKPIYMGYEGKVYDVSSGRNFYGAGQGYNYLTGRDATAELNEVGVGEIIVRKYPVIGKLNK